MNRTLRFEQVMLNPQPLPPKDLVIRWNPGYIVGPRAIVFR
jgi:hypothetical protein